jgi:hypothetical protein
MCRLCSPMIVWKNSYVFQKEEFLHLRNFCVIKLKDAVNQFNNLYFSGLQKSACKIFNPPKTNKVHKRLIVMVSPLSCPVVTIRTYQAQRLTIAVSGLGASSMTRVG